MSDHRHPYTSLPKSAYWKSAVADVDSQQIDLAWKPKFPVDRETGIITAGSCFAQHISKSLVAHGFRWLDSEPAPLGLLPSEHAKNGYGVFSFRTGNIYTAALLKQWVTWATGKAKQSTESFLHDGRYFDPFRPSTAVDGYASIDQMLAARQTTLAAMLDTLQRAGLFIFTLGLTEAWLNKDGSVYPMCPGTIRGAFVPEDHVFHNYNDREVVRDLSESFDELRRINPDLRFLLTVSPVPLTATASGQHVLTATTYSKAVLRSAAGYLAQDRDDTDYFPSYELITAPAFGGRFFEQNMRSVSSDGVAFVMGQFFDAVDTKENSITQEISVSAKVEGLNSLGKTESSNDICDDIVLETWSNKPPDESSEPPNILLIGDSQMGMIAKVLDEQSVRYAGGAIMHGAEWHRKEFSLIDTLPYFIPAISEAKLKWQDACSKSLLKLSKSKRHRLWIVTNIGCHVNDIFSPNGIFGYLKAKYGIDVAIGQQTNVNFSDFQNYLASARSQHIEIINRLRKSGFKVIWVSDPPVNPALQGMFNLAEGVLNEKLRAINCHTFMAKQWIDTKYGGLPKEFLSTDINPFSGRLDTTHGSLEYYRHLTREIFDRFSIKPK